MVELRKVAEHACERLRQWSRQEREGDGHARPEDLSALADGLRWAMDRQGPVVGWIVAMVCDGELTVSTWRAHEEVSAWQHARPLADAGARVAVLPVRVPELARDAHAGSVTR